MYVMYDTLEDLILRNLLCESRISIRRAHEMFTRRAIA